MQGSLLFEKLLEWGRAQQNILNERTSIQGNTLSAWLILGNAGGLVIALKAISDGVTCEGGLLYNSAAAFAVGLVLTFAGLAIGFFVSLWMMRPFSKAIDHLQGAWIAQGYIDKLEADGIEVPDDAPLQQTVDTHGEALGVEHRRMQRAWIGAVFATAIVFAGGVSFSVGALGPILAKPSLATCQVPG